MVLRTFPLAYSRHSRRLDQLPYIKKLDQLLTDVMIDSLTRMFVLPRTMTVYRQEEPAVDFLDAAMLPRAILRLQVLHPLAVANNKPLATNKAGAILLDMFSDNNHLFLSMTPVCCQFTYGKCFRVSSGRMLARV
jgi:hypothetical protein